MNQIKMNSFNGSTSIAGLGKAYGFGSTGNTGSNSGNNGNSHVRSRRRHGGKAKKMNVANNKPTFFNINSIIENTC